MAMPSTGKLNWLGTKLPEGLVVDAAWLEKYGYSTALRSQYLKAGWLNQPTRGVYRRGSGTLSWQHVVISLQTILEYSPLIVGGRSSLELQGYSHYLSQATSQVYLYGPKAPPSWVQKLQLEQRFIYRNSSTLFANTPITLGLNSLAWDLKIDQGRDLTKFQGGDITTRQWGQWDWPLTISTPERAILELLDELPNKETFHQADKVFEGLATLSPRRLQKLLADCTSIKVKRLFFFFADRHNFSWVKRLDKSQIDFGTGKRMLVKGGRLDPVYQITVPEDLDGLE